MIPHQFRMTNAEPVRINPALDLPMPSFESLYAFIRDEYLNSRFEGRNAHWPKGVPEGGTYSELIAKGYMDVVEKTGEGVISHFESRRGKYVRFNRALQIINPDSPVIEIKHKAGSLSNPMVGDWS